MLSGHGANAISLHVLGSRVIIYRASGWGRYGFVFGFGLARELGKLRCTLWCDPEQIKY